MTAATLRTRLASALAAAGLLAASLVTSVLLTEAAYRVARHYVCLPGAPGFFVPRPWGWTHRPHAAFWVYSCAGRRFEWRTWVEINGNGLRDDEHPYAKPPGRQRVLLLGDSITEGLQVPLPETFAKRVEAALRAEGRDVEVINGGHAAFGTDNELLFYREEGRRYEPDLVVQVFNLQNDVLENSRTLYLRAYATADTRFPPKPWFTLEGDGTLRLVPVSASEVAAAFTPTTLTRWQWMSSELFVLRAAERALSPAGPAPAGIAYPLHYDLYLEPTPEWSDAWRVTLGLTQALRREVEASGARFTVALMPAKEMVASASFEGALAAFHLERARYDLDRPRQTMLAFLRAQAVPFVDLFPPLAADATSGAADFFEWDVHLTDAGHAAVTPPLASFVEAQLESGEAGVSRRTP